MKNLWIALITLTLSACSGCSGLTTHEQQLAAGCASSSAALKALTVANDAGKLTPAQQTQIISAAGYIEPVCSADTPPTLDSVKLEAFARAIALLQAQAVSVTRSNP